MKKAKQMKPTTNNSSTPPKAPEKKSHIRLVKTGAPGLRGPGSPCVPLEVQ